MAQRELDCRLWKSHPMGAADLRQSSGALDQLARCLAVVVGGVVRNGRSAKQSGVVHRSCDNADPAEFRDREQIIERALLEQRVAAREHDEIDVGPANEPVSYTHLRAHETDS